ncbi:MAG: restriction endonuclease subunit S [Geobacteraceae bacterium]|nr:restriction endonuclease subunit S [Geobacteraceae bacterium]
MRLETFFEKFELFAEAPNAVAKMRELVLQLAMQGKLTHQDPADGDADIFLREIADARAAKGRGKISGVTPEVRIADHDKWYEVPPSWRWVRLGSVGDIVGGGTPRSDNAEFFAEEGIPWLTPADLNGYKDKKISRGRRCITPLGLANSSTQLLPAGSVLFSSRAPIGYVAIAETDLATNQGFKSCVPFIMETNEFLYYFLMSAAARIDREASGTTFREVSGKIVSQIPVPLPPLAEQKRIVAKVDELLALCDRLDAQQQERDTQHTALARAALTRFADAPTPANLNLLFHPSYAITPADIRKTILTLAVQGKLVQQDANDEPVDDLLKQIEAEKQSDKRTKATENREVNGNDALCYDIPDTWRWQALDDILVFGPTNGFSPKAVDYETPVRSLSLSATTSGRFKGEYSKFITTEVPPDSDLWLNDGDILVQRGNTIEYVGVAAVYHGESNSFIYPDLMMKIRVSSAVAVDFVHLAMSQDASRDFLRARASGTSGSMPKINQTTLKSLPIPLPPLAEQRRIVAKADQLMALVDQLEMQLAASRTTAINLMEAVVAELTIQE